MRAKKSLSWQRTMSDRLVTVATFQDSVAAALAKNFLEHEGIPCVLIDDTTVATDWMLSAAIGGVKLQVAALDLERAEMLLVQIQQIRDEAEEDEDEDEGPTQSAIATREIAEELQAEQADRAPINQLADKVFRTAVFGLLFWPLQLYVLYLLACIYAEEGKVSPERRWKVWAAVLLNMPLMSVIVVPLLWCLQR
jgi:Putative prokaryotic signal transducing protein